MNSSRTGLRYYVSLNGRERVVEIREDGERIQVSLDGSSVEADLTLLAEPSLHSLLLNGNSREMVLSTKGSAVQVSLDGESFEVRVLDEVSRALSQFVGESGSGSLEVAAPMPGVVVSIPVQVGEVVEVGRAIVVLEAMKMQNELTSEAAGIVKRIEVKVGDSVAGGAVLVVLKPAAAS